MGRGRGLSNCWLCFNIPLGESGVIYVPLGYHLCFCWREVALPSITTPLLVTKKLFFVVSGGECVVGFCPIDSPGLEDCTAFQGAYAYPLINRAALTA